MEERKKINFDHPNAFDWKLLTQQIQALREHKSIEQPTYSYLISNRLPETIHIEPCEVIIIEGIMALWKKELRDLMDLKIFVDADPDERLIRVIQRDIIERGRTAQMVIDRYREVLKPMHQEFIEPTKRYADLIIPLGGTNKQAIHIMRSYILHHVSSIQALKMKQ
jgi:uridine kinase